MVHVWLTCHSHGSLVAVTIEQVRREWKFVYECVCMYVDPEFQVNDVIKLDDVMVGNLF